MQNKEITTHERIDSKRLFISQFYIFTSMVKSLDKDLYMGTKTIDFPAVANHFKQE
jgi:hypothetical protein